MLVCALHSQDPALDAPWALEESSAAAMSILTELAHSMGCTDAGDFLCQTLSWLWLHEAELCMSHCLYAGGLQ